VILETVINRIPLCRKTERLHLYRANDIFKKSIPANLGEHVQNISSMGVGIFPLVFLIKPVKI
jgi:hypothetical protein